MEATILPVMAEGRRQRNFNLGNWLVGAGALALVASFWVPFAAAGRTARAEERAGDVADVLLGCAGAMQPFDPVDPWQRDVLLARLVCACSCGGIYAADLALQEPPADAPGVLWLHNKHYLFQLGPVPCDPHRQAPANTIPALEVVAWPADSSCPGHAAFYAAEGTDAAFTRNLQADYQGTQPPAWTDGRAESQRRPPPGAGLRRESGQDAERGGYRGLDDERWLVLHTPALPPAVRTMLPPPPKVRRRRPG
jgi:hypothetical protein